MIRYDTKTPPLNPKEPKQKPKTETSEQCGWDNDKIGCKDGDDEPDIWDSKETSRAGQAGRQTSEQASKQGRKKQRLCHVINI